MMPSRYISRIIPIRGPLAGSAPIPHILTATFHAEARVIRLQVYCDSRLLIPGAVIDFVPLVSAA